MIKKTYALVGLGLTAVLLASCSGDNIEGVQTAVDEMDQIHENMIAELNGLSQEESNLQASFDESLSADEELTTFSDGSAAVFENISARRDRLETINSLNEDFESEKETIADYDGESLSSEELDELSTQAEAFSSQIETFTSNYETSLDDQESYFTSIGNDDATYDTFSAGITELNEQKSTMQDELIQLDESLVAVKEQITQAQEMIQSAMAEDE